VAIIRHPALAAFGQSLLVSPPRIIAAFIKTPQKQFVKKCIRCGTAVANHVLRQPAGQGAAVPQVPSSAARPDVTAAVTITKQCIP
jgi:hypothetical protein